MSIISFLYSILPKTTNEIIVSIILMYLISTISNLLMMGGCWDCGKIDTLGFSCSFLPIGLSFFTYGKIYDWRKRNNNLFENPHRH
jgi:hypothetical protein